MRWLLGFAAAVIVALVVELIAQLVLPGVAADRIREQLSKSGHVLDVEVSAFPALELIGHHADDVTVRMSSYRSSTSELAQFLRESDQTDSLHASSGLVTDGLMTLHDATLTKQGDVLTGSAQVLERDLTHAIPYIRSVTPVASTGGVLTLKGTADVPILGQITVPFVVEVRNGALVAAPDLPVVGALATIQLFANPHIAIDRVSAAGTRGGFSVTVEGRLR